MWVQHIEKSGERLVYGGKLPTYFRSDVLDEDVICTFGIDDRKILLHLYQRGRNSRKGKQGNYSAVAALQLISLSDRERLNENDFFVKGKVHCLAQPLHKRRMRYKK